MKILVNIVLFVFIAFMATPTIVGILESDTDTSIVYSFSEEEVQKEIKEYTVSFDYLLQLSPFGIVTKTSVINSKNEQKHDNVSEEIFSPPPEIV